MNKRIVQGLTQDQKKEFQDMLKYNPVIERIREVLKVDYEECATSRRSTKSLLTQNYSEYQADRNATERTLLKVLDIIKA